MTSKEIIEREIVKLTTSIQLALGCVPAMNINIELCQQKLSELKQIKQDLNRLEQLEKALDILKEYICITKRRNEVNGNYDISCIYSFGSYKDITQEAYELLKEVFDDEN